MNLFTSKDEDDDDDDDDDENDDDEDELDESQKHGKIIALLFATSVPILKGSEFQKISGSRIRYSNRMGIKNSD